MSGVDGGGLSGEGQGGSGSRAPANRVAPIGHCAQDVCPQAVVLDDPGGTSARGSESKADIGRTRSDSLEIDLGHQGRGAHDARGNLAAGDLEEAPADRLFGLDVKGRAGIIGGNKLQTGRVKVEIGRHSRNLVAPGIEPNLQAQVAAHCQSLA